MPQHRTHHAAPPSHGMLERVSHAAHVAQSGASKAANGAGRLVREHPFASLGVALGSGVLIGAVAHRLLEHRPTLGELLAERVGWDRVQRWRAAHRH